MEIKRIHLLWVWHPSCLCQHRLCANQCLIIQYYYDGLGNVGPKNVYHRRIQGNGMMFMEITGTIIFLNPQEQLLF